MMNLPETKSEKETQRIEAFSDGIFSVAITLLAIEIAVKENTVPTNAGLWKAILQNWPRYFGYFNSFAIVLLMWMGHHDVFKLLKRTSVNLMLANGLLLLLVALVPYPTRTLAEFIETPARQTAVIFYTGYLFFISLGFNLLWLVASYKGKLLDETVSAKKIKQITGYQHTGLLCNISITCVAFVSPYIALALSIASWIFWAAVMRD